MLLKKETIFEIFKELDDRINNINEKIDIYVLGGTFFVLRELRNSSPDVDIIVEGSNYNIIAKELSPVGKKFNVEIDLLTNRWLNKIRLPENYTKNIKQKTKSSTSARIEGEGRRVVDGV